MRSPARKTPTGRVVTRQGPVLTVQTPEGELIACIGQGKGKRAVVGDEVFTRPVNTDLATAAIHDIAPRRNELARADGTSHRARVIAANVDRVVVVVAVAPPIRSGLIDRLLVAAHAQGIPARIVLNKIDLLDRDLKEEAERLLSPYPPIGYPVLPVSARTGKHMDELAEWLQTGTSILIGHSGVGKTSLLNGLCPGLGERVRALSDASGRGVHTTTTASLFALPGGGEVIDSPGIRMFALWGIESETLAQHFVDFAAFAGECRFANCQHDHEPGCAVKDAVEEGRINDERYDSYLRLRATLAGSQLRGADW
ncbi:MAG: ribosome small subunit-dependent GTPase A [Myxococcales bacterium]|nr:ribosome small subunit-dependent GTPase A [Myxococcales bacterium]